MNNIIFKTLLLKGEAGAITSIEKTSTDVLTDTYTIYYNDGTTTTFEVTNGNGITDISKTSTSGLTDTYTITYADGTTTTFEVTNGNQAIYYFNTFGEMIASTVLRDGNRVKTLGYYQVNDGGGAEYLISQNTSANTKNVSLNNGLYAQLVIADTINVKWLGAKGNLNDGTFDDSIPINEALNLAKVTGDCVLLDGDTFTIRNPIVIDSNTELKGVSKNKTIIRMADNSDCNVIESYNFNTLINADESTEQYQPQRITLHDFKVEGNSSNNTSGNGIALFATACLVYNIWISDATDNGLYLGFRDAWIPDMETSTIPEKQSSTIHDVDIYQCGEHGIYADKAHDTYYENIAICNASQKQDNTYDGIHLTSGCGGRFVHYHGWSATQGYRDRYSLYHPDNSPLEIVNSHLEGSRSGCIYITSNAMISNTRFYVSYSEKMITVAGSLNSFSNCVFQPSLTRNTMCIDLLANTHLNKFDCTITNQAKFADEVNSTGQNIYNLNWLGNLQSLEVVSNMKDTSLLSVVSNYEGNYSIPSNIFNGNVNVAKNITEQVSVETDPTEVHYVHDERYLIYTSNTNDQYIALQTNLHRKGRIITIKNLTNNSINCYVTAGCIIDGVAISGTNYAIPANTTTTLVKISVNDVWITI